jgi:radical SAM protein with 4Fe4S-binding SPASM domain
MREESICDKAEEMRKIFDEAVAVGDTYGVNVKIPYIQGEDIAGEKEHKDCYVGWRDFFLGSDGYVRSCMSTCKKLFHISKYDSFDKMWNSKEYQEFRAKVNSGDMDVPCRNCYQASFANWNKKSSFIQIGNEFAPTWEKNA